LAGRPRNESEAIKRKDHLVDRGWSDFKVALEVGLRRWTTVDFRVGIEESQILTLQVREVRHPYLLLRQPTRIRLSGRRPLPAAGGEPVARRSARSEGWPANHFGLDSGR